MLKPGQAADQPAGQTAGQTAERADEGPAAGAAARRRTRPVRLGSALRSLAESFTLPAPFDPPAMEQAFLRDYGHRFAPFRRAGALLAFVLVAAFAGWDYAHYLLDPAFPLGPVLAWRAFSSFTLGCATLYSLRHAFCDDRRAHLALMTGVASAAATQVGISVIVESETAYSDYFVTLYLVMIYQFGFLHLRARPVLLATIATTAAIVLVHVAHHAGLPFRLLGTEQFGKGMLYLLNIAVIGMGICIKFERYARQQFRQELELLRANRDMRSKHALLQREQEENALKAQALIRLKEAQRAQALQLSQENARFLASATHDLRQPMFSLGLALDGLQHALDNGAHAEARTLLDLSRRSARAMNASLNAVLDLSRLESGLTAPELRCFDVGELVREVVAELSPHAGSCGVLLRAKVRSAAPVSVFSDRQMLGRILQNLVSNGIKYARHDGTGVPTVMVAAVRMATHIRLDVVDNGIGIPAAQWRRIFEPFVQLDNPEHDRSKGLGLGLANVNAAISLLPEHRLEFKSRVGHGTRFSIDVPRGLAEAPHAEPAADHGPGAPSMHGLYAVLIEDDPLVRSALEALFTQWGMLVDAVAGLAPLRKLADELERLPDVIVSDYRLADGATAREALALLLPCCRGRDGRLPPVLVISGEAGAAEMTGAANVAGADAVLLKPVQADQLRSVLLGLVAARGAVAGPPAVSGAA